MPIRLLLLFFCFTALPALAQYELPGSFQSKIERIPEGSLVIAMDTVNQYRPGYFNMKAYGLVTTLLENEIPVYWAIRKGKSRTSLTTQVDFSANVTRVFPDTGTSSAINFSAGPFIIDSAYVEKAVPVILSFANNVNVFRLNAATNIDIRYHLIFKPRVCLMNMGGYDTITVKIMQEASIPASVYTLRLPNNQIFTPSINYSLISEQHYQGTDTALINPPLRYVSQLGGNMIANCATIGSIENTNNVMTTGGIDSSTSGISAVAYFNIDLPTAQFHGNIVTPNGDYKYWGPKPSSTFKTSTAYQLVRSGNGAGFYIVAGTKLRPINETGGILTYLPGHSFFMNSTPGSINETVRINGRRIYLNHMFIPPSDTILQNLSFLTDIAVSLTPQTGFAVKNESFQIKVTATNIGPGSAKNIKVNAPSSAAGLNYLSYFTNKGTYNNTTGTWLIDSLSKGQSVTLTITFTISQLGNISYTSVISSNSYELLFENNTATLNLWGVSRPNAENDYLTFNQPAFIDYNVKVNDSDEDEGPFGVTQILKGPYYGSAFQMNDTIRYQPGGSFTGKDSILYLLCDQLPLCDSAWVIINIPSPLPVDLGTFTGERDNRIVKLRWNTFGEKDNDYFLLERSHNGREFTPAGKVKGVGNSSDINWYDWNEPDDHSPVLYYRLKQVDFNGKTSSNAMIALPLRYRDLTFNLYPNPAEDEFVLQANNIEGSARFMIHDLSGRVVLDESIQPDSRHTIMRIQKTDGLSKGLYFVTLQTETEIRSVKFLLR